MKERPLLFSAPMIIALLEGRKNQTRRALKMPPRFKHWVPSEIGHDDRAEMLPGGLHIEPHGRAMTDGNEDTYDVLPCPYGVVGDRLWVRESFARGTQPNQFFYMASRLSGHSNTLKWKPSIHMPRAASRLSLELTGIRVERLQDISEADAMAEGARHFPDLPSIHPYGQDPRWSCGNPTSTDQCLGSAKHAFGSLWESINGAGSWDLNPWVWCLSFKRVTP